MFLFADPLSNTESLSNCWREHGSWRECKDVARVVGFSLEGVVCVVWSLHKRMVASGLCFLYIVWCSPSIKIRHALCVLAKKKIAVFPELPVPTTGTSAWAQNSLIMVNFVFLPRRRCFRLQPPSLHRTPPPRSPSSA
jgi:hypothetical protein